LAFCERERREIASAITAWCLFVDGDTRNEARVKSTKKSRASRTSTQKAVGLGDLLAPTRNRLKDSLRALGRQGIEAKVISEGVSWNFKPALWITCDTVHPIATLKAIEAIWHHLVAVFKPDRDKIVRMKAIDLLWSSIVLVPLVAGKSVERQAIPHFKGVTYLEPRDLEQSPWRLFPENIPEDIWPQLRLDHWDVQPSCADFDRFAAAFGHLFHHVDHMADFHRLPHDLDELGLAVLQSYLDHEITRAQPLLQDLFDTCGDFLGTFPEINTDVINSRPNICVCLQLLLGMKDAMMPTPDFHERASLSTEQIVDWRDRLLLGMRHLGVARYLWIADSLKCGACPNLS
jgi:hypothetical protein